MRGIKENVRNNCKENFDFPSLTFTSSTNKNSQDSGGNHNKRVLNLSTSITGFLLCLSVLLLSLAPLTQGLSVSPGGSSSSSGDSLGLGLDLVSLNSVLRSGDGDAKGAGPRPAGGGRVGDIGDIPGDSEHRVLDRDDPGGVVSGATRPPVGGSSDNRLLSLERDARQPGLLPQDVYPVDSFPPKAPIIPDIFTVAVETIYMKEQKRQVWNLHVDRAEKIVVHKVDMPNTGKRYEWFYSKIVRDFRSGLEFRISNGKDSPDCVVEPISTEFELTSHNLKRFMLEHATLLLNFDPSFVNYWGKRSIRNLQCDIWLHESLGEFVSEFGFANDSTLPISVATFSRESKPDIVAISNIYEDNSHIFNPFAKTQGHPDVSECLDPTPILLRIILDAPYIKLKMGREFTVLESIRRAVAGLAGISLLRVTDLALTEWPGGTSAFWFSLRQIVNFQELTKNSSNSGTPSHSTIVFPLSDAYRILRDVIQRHDVTLRVDLASNEHMLVGIQRGSLISIPRSLHPIFMRNMNTKSLSVIKASYTSGAVAGLGLAMAVLGLAIGLLLGFVLWNGSTRVRYWRYPWANSPIPYGLGDT